MIPKFNFFGRDAKFHHIGIVVNSIKSISPYSKIFIDKIQNVYVAFVSLNGVTIELIEPLNDISPVTQSLKKGIKFMHICYEVINIDKTLKKCRKYGFHCIAKPVPAIAFGNRKIAWVYSKEYGLFELLQK